MEGFVLQHFYEASGCVVEEGDFKLWGTHPGGHAGEGIAGELLDMMVQEAHDAVDHLAAVKALAQYISIVLHIFKRTAAIICDFIIIVRCPWTCQS